MNIGNWVGQHLGFDITRGFNLGYQKQGSFGTIRPTITRNGGGNSNTVANKPATRSVSGSNGSNVITIDGPTSNTTYGSFTPQVDQNQTYKDIINSALGRLPGQLNTAKANIRDQYNTNMNELNSGKTAANQQYDQSTDQNQQQYVTNKNQINSQASSGLRSLLRVLGQHGAGGSSAALYAAPDAVGQVAQEQRSGASQNYGQNQQALDTNWNNYLSGYENSKKQLNDWLTQQNQKAESSSEQSRQDLLQQLLQLSPDQAAANDLVSKINASAGKVDSLARFRPTYGGKTPVYTAPEVASYTVGEVGAPQLGAAYGNSSAGGSVLSYLLGMKPEDRQQQPLF